MIDKLVIKSDFNGLKPGMLVELDLPSADNVAGVALALDMKRGDVGLILETTHWETHLGDDQLNLHPIVVVLVRGKKTMVIPKCLREVKHSLDQDLTVINYSTHNLPIL